jgi:hypothetical protein
MNTDPQPWYIPYLGLGTEFHFEKIPRNRLGMVSVIPRKKAPIPSHSEFRGRANSDARNGTERNGMPRKRLVLQNISKITYKIMLVFLPRNGSEQLSESLFQFFVSRKGIPNCVLFRGMVRNGIPRICIYFGSIERNFVSDFLKTYLSVRY